MTTDSPGQSVSGPSLRELFERHDGPRAWKWSHYLDVYETYLVPWRGRAPKVLEIGVLFGGSTRLFQEYLGPDTEMYGIDHKQGALEHAPDPSRVSIGDQGDRAFLTGVADRLPRLDIVIDDGSHRSEDQIASFEVLYPRLSETGLYIVEDTHSSYWPDLGGGYGAYSFVDLGKNLIDRLHAWYWYNNAFSSFEEGVARPTKTQPNEEFARTTWAIHFHDSMCVIEKRPRERPTWRLYGRADGGDGS